MVSRGLNRAGNILIPNDNYCAFEDWLTPILDECLKEQEEGRCNWTPSKLIKRLGEKINNEDSILYWAARNHIPIFCPALTDGSLGDMLYFHAVKNSPGLRLDIVEDVRHINTMAVKSHKTGTLILGGGVVKHHINNANLMRNGSDFTVYINTGMVISLSLVVPAEPYKLPTNDISSKYEPCVLKSVVRITTAL
ncbi:Deoxyhypusine synthase [Trichostrongylus colubriformis]|uniref:Deoxyhypusine synthase n=1 Tax=Trichostrongylus colubriformis TaxID=6319 RepID=A0AAN8ISX0_TRICO